MLALSGLYSINAFIFNLYTSCNFPPIIIIIIINQAEPQSKYHQRAYAHAFDKQRRLTTEAVVTGTYDDDTSAEYHDHHHHQNPYPGDDDDTFAEYHDHHQHQNPYPVDAAWSALGQIRKPHSILKARAVMTADSILVAGVQNEGNLASFPTAATGKQSIFGLVNFEQTAQGVHVTGRIDGLGQETSHGFHVHEFGDVSSGCTTAGAHFNPFNQPHGGLDDGQRHVGDLGNVTADAYGAVHLNILNPIMSLHGKHSIVGRAIVIHAMPDDLGRGGNEDSTKTGNSGARLACGIIGLTKS